MEHCFLIWFSYLYFRFILPAWLDLIFISCASFGPLLSFSLIRDVRSYTFFLPHFSRVSPVLLTLMYVLSALHVSFWCLRVSSLYFQDANGPSAEALLSFSDLTLILVLPICFGVISFLFSLLLHSPSVRYYVENQFLEFIWTFTPALLLLLLALPSLSLLYLLDEVGTPVSTLKVQGHQ